MAIKLKTYCFASLLLTLGSVGFSFYSTETFYESMIFMTDNQIIFIILSNFVFTILLLASVLVKRIFFGSLSNQEIETIVEKSKWYLLNIFFTITMFTNQITNEFIVFVSAFILFQIFHWIVSIRVESMTQNRIISRFDTVKLLLFLLILILTDAIMLYLLIKKQIQLEKSFELVAIFETSVLLLMALFTLGLFYLNIVELRRGHWQKKSFYLFFFETLYNLNVVLIYIVFIYLITMSYGFPVFLLRDLYIHFARLKELIFKRMMYFKLLKEMNQSFIEVRASEMSEGENICIICRDNMMFGKKIPCGHIFHSECLQNWFERQSSCPTCRSSIPLNRNRLRSTNSESRQNRENPPQNNNQNNQNNLQNNNNNQNIQNNENNPSNLQNGQENNFSQNTTETFQTLQIPNSIQEIIAQQRKTVIASAENNPALSTEAIVAVPVELFEAQTAILQAEVESAQKRLSEAQQRLNLQLRLQREFNIYLNNQRRNN